MTPLLNISADSIGITDDLRLTFTPKWFLPKGVTVILGPNGAGKTLLLNLLADSSRYMQNRIIPATAGSDPVTVRAGRDTLPLSADESTLLLLDNLYDGLDADERADVNTRLRRLADGGCNIVLTLSDPRLIPDFANSAVCVSDLNVAAPEALNGRDIDTIRRGYKFLFGFAIDLERIPATLYRDINPTGTVCEAATTALSVKAGDKISLTGGDASTRSALMRELASVCSIPAGYVGQPAPNDEFLSGLTVTELVGDSLRSAGFDSRERTALAAIWLDIFHLSHLAGRLFGTLSSGERQQVMLLGALIGCPPVLLLDEPMYTLDYGRRRSLRAMISYMATRPAATPTTIVATSADPYDMPECVNMTYNISTHETQANINH